MKSILLKFPLNSFWKLASKEMRKVMKSKYTQLDPMGVFTCSILASIVTILVSIVIILTSIEPILEKYGHLQVQC